MNRISKVLVLGIFYLPLFGQDGVHSSTVTFSAGGETPTYNVFGESSGPVFAGNYEYRIMKYLALEGGFQSMLTLTNRYEFVSILSGTSLISFTPCPAGCIFFNQPNRTLVNLVPFGAKVILPLASDRFELFAGGGGAHAFHSDGGYLNAMLAQGSLGGRIAIDKAHRFWLGTSGRLFGASGNSRQEWLSWTADFGIRF